SSNDMTYMCDPPFRIDQKVSVLESGAQLTCMKGSYQKSASASFRSGPPNAGIRKMPLASGAHLAKAISVPSGDHAALIQCAGRSVNLIVRSEPIALTYKSNPCSRLLLQANATWLPSGENVGEISWPGRLVNGYTLTDEKSGSLEFFLNQSTTPVKDTTEMRMTAEKIQNVVRRPSLNPTFVDGCAGNISVAGGGVAIVPGVARDGAGRLLLVARSSSRSFETTSTVARNRYPRRGKVSMYRGFSAESPKASLRRFTAAFRP